MKKLLFILIASVTLVSCGDAVETYIVEERTINESVYASGEIMPFEYYFLKAGTSERVLSSLVKEGDTVKAGDVLTVLGTDSENKQLDILTRQVALARQSVSENSAQLKELKGRIRLAKQKYEKDSANASRHKELAKEKAVSEREYDQARIQAESSRTEYENLQLQYETQKNQLNERLLNAEQQLAILKQSREGKLLNSPVNGLVYSIYFEEGEMVQPHEPIMMVGLAGKYKLELLVDERDITKVKIGQKLYFETDAFSERQFEGRIKKIVSVLQKATRSFAIEAEVLSQEVFYPQSSVEANILIREDAKVLVIPADYLLAGDSVKVQRADGVQKLKIEPGISNRDWLEVKSGLQKGDVVVKE
ncbi:MAG: efflux RND transporter periplasmic adaptor subunit [Cytophagaceae bacterium]